MYLKSNYVNWFYKNKFQESNNYFLKAQTFAPLMDNPFFSHADLLRRGADKLIQVNNIKQADSLLKYAHENLDKAEKLIPLRPQTHYIRGLIYKRDQLNKAKQEFEKALKLDPRFLFSRIRLAKLLHDENKLKEAMTILYERENYNYKANKVMLEYMTLFAKYSKEAGVESFAQHLDNVINSINNAKN